MKNQMKNENEENEKKSLFDQKLAPSLRELKGTRRRAVVSMGLVSGMPWGFQVVVGDQWEMAQWNGRFSSLLIQVFDAGPLTASVDLLRLRVRNGTCRHGMS